MNENKEAAMDVQEISKAALDWRALDIDAAALVWRKALKLAVGEQQSIPIVNYKGIHAPCLEAIRNEFAGFLWSWGMLRPEMAKCFLDTDVDIKKPSSMAETLVSGAAGLGVSMSEGRPPPFDLDAVLEYEEGGRIVSLRAASKSIPGIANSLGAAAVFFESACSGFDVRDYDLPTTVDGSEALASWDGVLQLNVYDASRMDWDRIFSEPFQQSVEIREGGSTGFQAGISLGLPGRLAP